MSQNSRRPIEPGTGAQPVAPMNRGERRWKTALAATLGESRSDARIRWVVGVAGALVVAFAVSVIVRPVGSYSSLVDGWGVDLFELAMGAVCLWRYLDLSRGSGRSAAPLFPLVLGAACCTWALGDVAITIESLGGATVTSPSVADGFYLLCYPMFFASLIMVVRRGNSGSLIATSLDGLIVGLGAASLSAAFLFSAVLRTTGGSTLSAAAEMAYPVGDLLLLGLAIGGLAILPRGFRRFLVLASVGFVANALGDTFHLLDPTTKIGFISDALAWPISLFMFAVATWAQPAHLKAGTANASEVNTEKTAGFALPAGGALAGIAVLIFASVGQADRVAISLATATLFVAGVRLVLTVRQAHALELGPLPLADRQRVGPHRGRRSRPPGRVHHPVVGAGTGLLRQRTSGQPD